MSVMFRRVDVKVIGDVYDLLFLRLVEILFWFDHPSPIGTEYFLESGFGYRDTSGNLSSFLGAKSYVSQVPS